MNASRLALVVQMPDVWTRKLDILANVFRVLKQVLPMQRSALMSMSVY